jgi:hypothetical protein
MEDDDKNAHGLGQGFSSPPLGHKSLLMDPAVPKYPCKLGGLLILIKYAHLAPFWF